jgi:hypothetical protein
MKHSSRGLIRGREVRLNSFCSSIVESLVYCRRQIIRLLCPLFLSQSPHSSSRLEIWCCRDTKSSKNRIVYFRNIFLKIDRMRSQVSAVPGFVFLALMITASGRFRFRRLRNQSPLLIMALRLVFESKKPPKTPNHWKHLFQFLKERTHTPIPYLGPRMFSKTDRRA